MVSRTLDANLVIGKKYNRLTIVDYIASKRHETCRENAKVICVCECGNKITSQYANVKKGITTSCGCYRREIVTTHLMSKTVEYIAWGSMKARCLYEKRQDFHRYGGRGIKVCDRWLNSFENFLEDMGKKPSKEFSLDRIDNNGNYEPGNCRWTTLAQQNKNKTYYQEGRRSLIICECCQKEFSVKKSKELGRKYCSRRCHINKRYNKLEGVS